MAPAATLIRTRLDIKLYEASSKQYFTVADLAIILRTTTTVLTPIVNSAPDTPKTLLNIPGVGDDKVCISNDCDKIHANVSKNGYWYFWVGASINPLGIRNN